MASIPKTERILNLISVLLKARRPVPWRQIRESVVGYNDPADSADTVARRFERDKTTLRQIGVPLVYVQDDGFGNEGYLVERGSYFLPQVEFTPEEIAVLALAGRAAAASGPLGAAMQSALSKLQFDSPIPGDVRSTVEEHYLFHHPAVEDSSTDAARLEALSAAVLENRTVTFTYRSGATGESARRRVDPYGLAFWSGHWYLAGYSHMRGAIRTFRLDRIGDDIRLASRGEGPDFTPPEDFDIEQHIGKPPWRLRSAAETRVTIHLDSTVAWMVEERSHESDTWTENEDGSAVLERSVTDTDALVRWLLRFGTHAEILAPVEIRDRFLEVVKRIRDTYALPSRPERCDE